MKDKIIEFFDEIGIESYKLFKTDRAGDAVDNRAGVEFNLPEYAIISEWGVIYDDSIYEPLIEFEDDNNIRFLKLYDDTDYALTQLERDGYKLIHEK